MGGRVSEDSLDRETKAPIKQEANLQAKANAEIDAALRP
jgi:hypothetical protein